MDWTPRDELQDEEPVRALYDAETRETVKQSANIGAACDVMASRFAKLGMFITRNPKSNARPLAVPVTHAVRVGLSWGVGGAIREFGSGWFFEHPGANGDHLVGTAGTDWDKIVLQW